jgi:hypothetical protein
MVTFMVLNHVRTVVLLSWSVSYNTDHLPPFCCAGRHDADSFYNAYQCKLFTKCNDMIKNILRIDFFECVINDVYHLIDHPK